MAGTIVYVDDDPDLPSGLENELAKIGFRLEYTTDFAEAFEVASEGVVRVFLIEVLGGGGAGWELIERIRSLDPPNGDVPIVIYTREERTPTLYSRAVELGANDFLSRPVIRAEVLGAILECVEACEAGPPVEPIRASADRGGAAEASGNLQDFPLPELLLELREVGATGVLLLQDFEGVIVQLRNGSPIGLGSSRGDEGFADFLMRTKRITDAEHEQLLERASMHGESEPQAAVAIGILSKRDAQTALEDRSAEPLLEAFGWTSGTWRFEPNRRIKSGFALERGGARVLAQGVLEWTHARSIRVMLDRRGAHYLSKIERAPISLDDLSTSVCDHELLDAWAGDRTVAQVLASGAIGERELYALLVAGLAESFEAPPLELTQVIEGSSPPAPTREDPEPPILELDCEIVPEPEIDLGPAPSLGVDEPEAPEPAPSPTESSEPRVAAAAALLSGLKPKAKPSENVVDSEEADPAARAEKLREAERHFMEGETALADKRYDDAVAAFGMASHLDPDQGEYRAHLGYALHLQNPRDELVQKEALEHIAKGIKLAPEQWRPLLYLARVFIATDEQRNALKVLVNASRKHPDCEPIQVELRALRAAEKKSSADDTAGLGGKLKRFLGKS